MDLSMRIVCVRRSEGSEPPSLRGARLEWGREVLGGMGERTFEGSGFEEAEHVHAEFFQVFREDQLAWWVGAGKAFPVAGEDVDGLLGQSASDVFQRSLGHLGCSC